MAVAQELVHVRDDIDGYFANCEEAMKRRGMSGKGEAWGVIEPWNVIYVAVELVRDDATYVERIGDELEVFRLVMEHVVGEGALGSTEGRQRVLDILDKEKMAIYGQNINRQAALEALNILFKPVS